MHATDYGNILLGSRQAHTHYWGGALWSSSISHTFTMSHGSSGLTVCFPPQGAAVRALGVQPTLWNWDYLLMLSHYLLNFWQIFGRVYREPWVRKYSLKKRQEKGGGVRPA
jgi:hypothetical protein